MPLPHRPVRPRTPRPDGPRTTLRLARRAAVALGVAAASVAVVLPQLQPDPPARTAGVAAAPSATPDVARERALQAASRSRRAAAAPAAAAPVLQRVRVEIPFRTVRREDPARLRGREKVVRAGRDGVRVRTYRVAGATRTLVGDHVGRLPVTRVVAVGTRTPQARPATAHRAGRERRADRARTAERRVSRGSAGDGLDWSALARCESGGNPRATNPSGKYRGLYQFDRRTWASVGGSGDPAAASAAEQTRRAQRLYARSGRSPWPSCGRRL